MIKVLVEVIPRHLYTLREVCALFQFQDLSNLLELCLCAGGRCVLSKSSEESCRILGEV